VCVLGALGQVACVTEEAEAEESLMAVEGTKQGQFCGGIAGIACPEGLVCVDDPSDSCDPEQGGADCGGICVKPKKDSCKKKDPIRIYVSRDPKECAYIRFQCLPGFTPFFDECGCGCEAGQKP
jgi:hypothetical protein